METTKNELYLKTVFACMACDGDIATEEIAVVKELADKANLFSNFDVESKLNDYVSQINQQGRVFLTTYLNDIANTELTKEEVQQLQPEVYSWIEECDKDKLNEREKFYIQFFSTEQLGYNQKAGG